MRFLKRTPTGEEAFKSQPLKPSERRLLADARTPIAEDRLADLGIPDIDLMVSSLVRRGWMAWQAHERAPAETPDDLDQSLASNRIKVILAAEPPPPPLVQLPAAPPTKPTPITPDTLSTTPPSPHQTPRVVHARFSDDELIESAAGFFNSIGQSLPDIPGKSG